MAEQQAAGGEAAVPAAVTDSETAEVDTPVLHSETAEVPAVGTTTKVKGQDGKGKDGKGEDAKAEAEAKAGGMGNTVAKQQTSGGKAAVSNSETSTGSEAAVPDSETAKVPAIGATTKGKGKDGKRQGQ